MDYGKEILSRVDAKGEGEKGKITFYLSKQVYADFKKRCGNRPASAVLEEMMRHFNESTQLPKQKK